MTHLYHPSPSLNPEEAMANDGHGADSSEDQDVPAVFKQVPPEWVPQTSNTADLGQLKSRNTNYMIFVTYN